jgi:hypothetical protein
MKNLLLIAFSFCLLMCKSASVTPETTLSPALSSLKEYLIFGNVAIGWGCRGSQMYMLADGKLYADTLNAYCAAFKAQKPYVFSGYQLPDTEYQKAKNMLSGLPTGFLTSSQKTFGCPGCADGGMLYLAYKKEGLIENDWKIDDAVYWRSTDTANMPFPPYVDSYGKTAYQVLQILKTK